jgi:hypothetical protein
MALLMTIDEAAKEIGVPKSSLKSAAQAHGLIIRMGRALRIDPNQLPELFRKCQDQQKGQGSTNSSTARIGTSETLAKPTAQRAADAAKMLKKPSPPTLPQKGGEVLQMNHKT